MPKPSPAYPFNTPAGLPLAARLNSCWTMTAGSGRAHSFIGSARRLALDIVPLGGGAWSTDADGPVITTQDASDGYWSVGLTTTEWDDKYALSGNPITGFTMALWLTIQAVGNDGAGVMIRGEATKRKGFRVDSVASRTVKFHLDDGISEASATTSSAAYTVGTKVWLVAVFDGSQVGNSNRLKIYVNGTSASVSYTGTVPASTTFAPSSSTLRVGSLDGNANTACGLDLSLAYTWSRALSSGEITSLIADPYQFLDTGASGNVTTADYTLYYGYDAGTVNSTPVSEATRAAAYTNSDAAHSTFTALITSPDTQTFEGFLDSTLLGAVYTSTIVLSAVTGTVSITAGAALFTGNSAYVNSVLREVSGVGRVRITSITDSLNATGVVLTDFSTTSYLSGEIARLPVGFLGANNVFVYVDGYNAGTNDIRVVASPTGTDGSGRYPRNGTNLMRFRGNGPVIYLDPPTSAVGFYIMDQGDFRDTVTVDDVYDFSQMYLLLTFSDSSTLTVRVPHFIGDTASIPAAGSSGYVGVVMLNGKVIESVLMQNYREDGSTLTTNNDVTGIDDFTWALASQIPTIPQPPVTVTPAPGVELLPISEDCPPDSGGRVRRCPRCGILFVENSLAMHVCPVWAIYRRW